MTSLHQQLKQEALPLLDTSDLADTLRNNAETAEHKLKPLSNMARTFAVRIRAAPHAFKQSWMLNADEVSSSPILHHEQENRRHLDQEMINVSRLFNANNTANEQVIVDCENSPVLFGPKKGQSPSLEILRNHLAIPLRDRSGLSPVGFFPECSQEDAYRWTILKTSVSPS